MLSMKFSLTFFLFAGSLSLACGEENAGQRWVVTLLDKPFHVGDSVHKDMKNAKPDGAKFTVPLEIPASIPVGFGRSFQVAIEVTHMISTNDKAFKGDTKDGKLLSHLLVNGKDQGVLNQAAHGKQSAANLNRIAVNVPGDALQSGKNTLEIVPGGRGNDYDDFELQRVTISTLRPPK